MEVSMTNATPQQLSDFTANPDNTLLVQVFLHTTHPGIGSITTGYGKRKLDDTLAIIVFTQADATDPPADFTHEGITYPLAFVTTGEIVAL
jgi:hypothetical protein